MTTVIAVARDGMCVVAADTCSNVYDRPIIDGAVKIRRHATTDGGEFLLAYSGSAALPDLIQAGLTVAALPDDHDAHAWASAVAVAISEIAVAHQCTDDGKMDGSIILAAVGRLWTISHMMAIPHPDGIAAVGSGEGPAIGAADAMLTYSSARSTEYIAKAAAAIGIARDRFSAAPIQVETLDAAVVPDTLISTGKHAIPESIGKYATVTTRDVSGAVVNYMERGA